ncbi:hypothetical protein H9K57_24670 (plasmid) [Vibrio parahaemolyticus]|uniref:hypothetical protein n=1 Tax=Vibrio parahaemolyticus TaxID=670 RepID=UPI0020482E98|nr:hypothetical protein [Vibrio parahaemolyticus]UPR42114.1 hypothetical protein H9K57_24670 [Vibrio parahaemolyticus]
MRRIIGLVLYLLWGVNEVKAQDVEWIKSRLLMTHDFYNRIIYTRDIKLWGAKKITGRHRKKHCDDLKAIVKILR